MNTKNIYSYPIDKKYIKHIVTKESPGHIKMRDKNGVMCDTTRSIDFLCDEGTPIKASLDGEVVATLDNITKNYDKKKMPTEDDISEEEQSGNYTIIKHVSNEFSMYCHLGHKKVSVTKGQIVRTGDVIGYSGNTGWSISPHLHFMVFRFVKPLPVRDFESLEIRFEGE